MKFVDEYRDARAAARYARAIARLTTRPWKIMEICGGQTHAIVKFGVDELLPGQITLVHGPGCPVCVTPVELIEKALEIAARPEVIFCSFGDMLRVPGISRDLFSVKAAGGDVRIVYSPLDALRLAGENTRARGRLLRGRLRDDCTGQRHGRRAGRGRRDHQLLPPRLPRAGAAGDGGDPLVADEPRAGLPRRRPRLHGHGLRPSTSRIARRYRVPIVVTGFEPLDILQGIAMCIRQLETGRAEVENQYARAVRRDGNRPAQELIRQVFRVVPRKWRGVGEIPASGLGLRRRVRGVRRRDALRGRRSHGRGIARVQERACPPGGAQAARVPGLRRELHARASARRDHGLDRGRLRRVLPLPALPSRSRCNCREYVMSEERPVVFQCPIPIQQYPQILLAHGGGGALMRDLIEKMFVPLFANAELAARHDGALLTPPPGRLAFTTDSYVVRPLFFPGGDIGSLAVNGTVNDLAMCGARPRWLSAPRSSSRKGSPWRPCGGSSARCRRRPPRPRSPSSPATPR